MNARQLSIVGALLMLGCGQPRLDASSDDAAKRSVAKMTEALPQADREKFGSALMLVAFNKMADGKGLLGLAAAASSATSASVLKPLEGKTATEIMAEADRIRAEQAAKEHAQLLSEIAELEQKKKSADTAREALTKFVVSRSRFYKKQMAFLPQGQPVVELAVTNGTGKAVSRAYFVGTIATPGRSVPWLRANFNYEISGGLEAGESAQWALEPNMFSEWGKVEAPPDAVFTVSVERLDGADGNPLYDASWSEENQERLDALKSKAQ
ncbi:MAG TPA: DUF6694 family lipoprotein [Polyangiaceae bacterium]|nr:DUF6694 family lipoprotein [Polyangiaceae bacterium]